MYSTNATALHNLYINVAEGFDIWNEYVKITGPAVVASVYDQAMANVLNVLVALHGTATSGSFICYRDSMA